MNNNPYKTPGAEVEKDNAAYPRKRNAWIWVILVYKSLSVIGMIFSLVILRGGYIPIPRELQQYYNSLTPFDWALKIIIFTVLVLGLIYLFRLRKIAIQFFIADIVLSAITYGIGYFKKNNILFHHAQNGIGVILGFAIMVIIVTYLSKLQKRGVLQ